MKKHPGFIYVVTTLDTKSAELFYVSELIKNAGLAVRTVDLTTQPTQLEKNADISAHTVASFHPLGTEAVFCGDRGKAIEAMAHAFSLYLAAQTDVAAILGLGGSGGTALITPAMQVLPVGIPKLMVSTMASGDISGYIGASDISMMYSVTDVSGLNIISRKVLKNAANQIAGAVWFDDEEQPHDLKPAIALTMFGVTTPCVQQLTTQLEAQYDCLVFHATGSGGKAMEKLIDSQLLHSVLDITTTEVCDHLFGGVLACDEDRFGAIERTQTPCVMSCGALDMVNFGRPSSVPEHCQDRLFYHHNAQVTLMRTTKEENQQMGRWIAEKLNRCHGEVRFIIPTAGFSALDIDGAPFWDPIADQAFIDALTENLIITEKRQLILSPYHINSSEFCDQVIQLHQEILNK
ncbi:Tm-1-like ATP-binding domain-containing protein [Providencia huaxiensis]|uniref:Tm-1-like ATP-binding domain-containing protein n=1 Tax=Providencia huaxiensis TaxID=2027290 RepID=A0A8I2AEH0_9GAMM|nr:MULTISPECIES: Tm-1-like ATP-binding domain-containing protein [Providencia]MBN6361001.1 Tm-1-like ATP-binding domain-containing protein [Providencia huaxiensis]MBQ0268864.1 Tm-1-like ATP-binding domain-containing protein [Providencia huaxiensis]MBQ0535364.1 Tm-1-like ATP-binding domain-containing protein [Providencia huaxiensis]MBQ0590035.1 Tm-1-like ATP-binding domain-containing protein [Providencia huaxiensis]MCD2526714.1 Tm-1-like ATP-binding domain-containing protein [Providencia huaxie